MDQDKWKRVTITSAHKCKEKLKQKNACIFKSTEIGSDEITAKQRGSGKYVVPKLCVHTAEKSNKVMIQSATLNISAFFSVTVTLWKENFKLVN